MQLTSEERTMYLELIGEYCRAKRVKKYDTKVVAFWLRDHDRWDMPGSKKVEYLAEALSTASREDGIKGPDGEKARRRYCVKQAVEVNGDLVQQTLWADVVDLVKANDRAFLRLSLEQRREGINKDKRALERDLALIKSLFEEQGKEPFEMNLWDE